MDQTASRNELEKKLYRSFTLLSALIIVLSLGITLYFDITRQRADMDATISGTASYIASMPQVVSMLEAGYPSALAKQDIDSLCNNLPDEQASIAQHAAHFAILRPTSVTDMSNF